MITAYATVSESDVVDEMKEDPDFLIRVLDQMMEQDCSISERGVDPLPNGELPQYLRALADQIPYVHEHD